MTLRTLINAHPTQFLRQTWYDGEPFMDEPMPTKRPRTSPTGAGPFTGRHRGTELPRAVTLAWLYTRDPASPIWQRYLWCADTDRLAQRVFIGVNNGLMEIHRHLHVTARWGVATWEGAA